MEVEYTLKGDHILIEAYFPIGDRPAKNVGILARYSDGTEQKIGTTDNEGEVVFRPDKSLGCAIVAESSGHRGSCMIPSEEIAGVMEKTAPIEVNKPHHEGIPWLNALIGIAIIMLMTGGGYLVLNRNKNRKRATGGNHQ